MKLLSGGEEEIEGKTFLISTGSVLNKVNLEGLDETGFLDSEHGAGFASVFRDRWSFWGVER